MRAKVTLTKDIKDIPEFLIERIFDARGALTALCRQRFNCMDMSELAVQISEYRLELSDIDAALEDVQDMLSGYRAAVSPSAPDAEHEASNEEV
jgi:hypothetical protein